MWHFDFIKSQILIYILMLKYYYCYCDIDLSHFVIMRFVEVSLNHCVLILLCSCCVSHHPFHPVEEIKGLNYSSRALYYVINSDLMFFLD